MDKQQKVKISKSEEEHSTNWCSRCDRYFCKNCIEFHKLEFSIEEDVFEGSCEPSRFINYKEEMVCPWCYNQLVDKFNSKVRK